MFKFAIAEIWIVGEALSTFAFN